MLPVAFEINRPQDGKWGSLDQMHEIAKNNINVINHLEMSNGDLVSKRGSIC